MSRWPRAGRYNRQQTARILALCAAFGAFGLAVWSGSAPVQLDWSKAYASPASPAQLTSYPARVIATASYHAPQAQPAAAAAKCDPWDVSPVAMEAMLREMVRRGWQPPSGSAALASLQVRNGLPIQALDPYQQMWVAQRRGAAPVETGEVIDFSVGSSEPTADQDGGATAPATYPLPQPNVEPPNAPAPDEAASADKREGAAPSEVEAPAAP